MALWKDESGREQIARQDPPAKAPEKVAVLSAVADTNTRPVSAQARADGATLKESVIAASYLMAQLR